MVFSALEMKSEPENPARFIDTFVEYLDFETSVIKVKKTVHKILKGRGVNSELRLIYAHFIAEQKITFIELYHKNEQANEDKQRILNNFK